MPLEIFRFVTRRVSSPSPNAQSTRRHNFRCMLRYRHLTGALSNAGLFGGHARTCPSSKDLPRSYICVSSLHFSALDSAKRGSLLPIANLLTHLIWLHKLAIMPLTVVVSHALLVDHREGLDTFCISVIAIINALEPLETFDGIYVEEDRSRVNFTWILEMTRASQCHVL